MRTQRLRAGSQRASTSPAQSPVLSPAKDPIELEAALIRQEHRLIAVLYNYVHERKHWPKDDPRRAAATQALLWRLFSPGTAVVFSGGVVAVLSLIVLVGQWREIERQSGLFEKQNTLIEQQNQYFRDQISQTNQQFAKQKQQNDLARRTELIAILYETVPNPDFISRPSGLYPEPVDKSSDDWELWAQDKDAKETYMLQRLIPKHNARTRSEALLEFVQRERGWVKAAQARTNGTDNQPATDPPATQPSRQSPDDEQADPLPVRINLSKAQLQNIEVPKKADLRNVNFSDARLEGAVLSGARLEGADLSRARLEGADLTWARLEGADLFRARLEGADLFRARLEGTDLSRARLEGARLTGVRLEGADLSRARLEGADLRVAGLEGADLRGARLEGADLTGVRFESADLRETRLEGANLSRARLEGAKLYGARLEGADLRGADLANVEFWRGIESITLANIHGVKNATDRFVQWALDRGAVEERDPKKWHQMLRDARLPVPPEP